MKRISTSQRLLSLRFDPSYAFKIIRLLVHYPSLARLAFEPREELLTNLDKLILEEYSEKRVKLVKINGFQIYLNPMDVQVSPRLGVLGWIEGGTTQLFKRLVVEGSIVVDVGANLGWFSLVAASLVGGNGLVLSFEPDSLNFSYLLRSVELNRFRNVKAFQECVSDIDGTQRLFAASSDHPGIHSIKRNFGGPSTVVKSTKLDTLASNLGINHIDILKVDAEGAEPEVLQGATALLAERRIRNIIVEWNPEVWTDEHRAILEVLHDSYQFFQIADFQPYPLLRQVPQDYRTSRLEKNLYLRLCTESPNC